MTRINGIPTGLVKDFEDWILNQFPESISCDLIAALHENPEKFFEIRSVLTSIDNILNYRNISILLLNGALNRIQQLTSYQLSFEMIRVLYLVFPDLKVISNRMEIPGNLIKPLWDLAHHQVPFIAERALSILACGLWNPQSLGFSPEMFIPFLESATPVAAKIVELLIKSYGESVEELILPVLKKGTSSKIVLECALEEAKMKEKIKRNPIAAANIVKTRELQNRFENASISRIERIAIFKKFLQLGYIPEQSKLMQSFSKRMSAAQFELPECPIERNKPFTNRLRRIRQGGTLR